MPIEKKKKRKVKKIRASTLEELNEQLDRIEIGRTVHLGFGKINRKEFVVVRYK